MKLLGHGYVAVNSVPSGDKKLLILGSVVPEIMYYTKGHPFAFEEIHEGGEVIYRYLLQKRPALVDLGLGMMTHSVKYGADKFNFDKNLTLLGYEGKKVEELKKGITDILGVSYDTAKVRAHNILELAVELGIIREKPDFIPIFIEAVNDLGVRKEISDVLADCFQKPHESVSRSVEELFEKAQPEYFTDSSGLSRLWAELSKEFDPPFEIERLSNFLEMVSTSFEGKDKKFLTECITWTRNNIEKISRHPERIQ